MSWEKYCFSLFLYTISCLRFCLSLIIFKLLPNEIINGHKLRVYTPCNQVRGYTGITVPVCRLWSHVIHCPLLTLHNFQLLGNLSCIWPERLDVLKKKSCQCYLHISCWIIWNFSLEYFVLLTGCREQNTSSPCHRKSTSSHHLSCPYSPKPWPFHQR